MDRVEEIEAAIDSLPPEEFRRLADWFRHRDQEQWDEQIDQDSNSGKLNFLFDEAEDESKRGLLREWPPVKRGPSLRDGSGTTLMLFQPKFRL